MMNKYFYKKIPFNFIILVFILLLFPNNVEAKVNDKATGSGMVSVTMTPNNVSDIEDKLNLEVTVNAGEWKFQFMRYTGIDDVSELFDVKNHTLKQDIKNNYTTLTAGNIYSYEFGANDLKNGATYVILLKLNKKTTYNNITYNPGYYYFTDSGKVAITNVGSDKSDDTRKNGIGSGTAYFRMFKLGGTDDSILQGLNYTKEPCKLMREGRYQKKASDKDVGTVQNGESSDKFYISKMKQYFPYCWQESDSSPIEFSGKTINSARKNFIEYYNLVQGIKFSSTKELNDYKTLLDELNGSTDWKYKGVVGKNGNWSTDAGSLTCGTSLTDTNTDKYWTEKTVLSNQYCTVKCTERFTTTYSPPVATKAGLCFTYQVTVKSKVTCVTKKTGDIPWPTANKVKYCKMKAVCDDDTDQAGPSDEFDSCINECDGGKYSQSCINKCYNKVYKSSSSEKDNTKKMVNHFSSKVSVKLMADDKANSPYKYYQLDDGTYFNLAEKCSTKTKLMNNLDTCAKGFKEAKAEKPFGSYKKSGKKWEWNPTGVAIASKEAARKYVGDNRSSGPNSVINSIRRAAPYYLRSVAETKELLKSFFAIDTGYNGIGNVRHYNIDEHGIKRQVSSGWSCEESCWFQKTKESNQCNSQSEKELKDKYENEIKVNQSAIKACSTTSAELCSTSEATFTIGADNKVTNPEDGYVSDKTFKNWNKTGNENKSGNGNIDCGIDRQSNLLNDIFAKLPTDNTSDKCTNGVNGKCYGSKYPDWEYKTTITFPGAWINLKTGEVEYTNGQKNDQGFELEKYKYCTMYNSKNTNENWWSWRVDSDRSSTAPSADDYNIHATVKKFGKFNWNLNFKCFYALSDSTGKCDPSVENCGGGNDSGCDPSKQQCGNKTSPENIDIRFVQTGKELFPNNRKRGFNWTSAATDIALRKEKCNSETTTCAATKGYDIDPGEYAEEIKAKGDKVYEEDPEVHIQINGKKDFEEIGSETSKIAKFEGKYGQGLEYQKGDIDGLYYYTSSILKDLKDKITKLDISYERGKNYK